MARPITLFTGQWADLPFEEVARLASEWGYQGLEIACWGDHLDPWQGAEDDAYIQGKLDLLERYNLKVYAISNHLKGQAVCDDPIDERHRDMLSDHIWGDGDPEGVRQRAAEEMKLTARTAARLGVKTVIGFTGSAIWKYVAMFPPVSTELIDAGYRDFADRWNPILDVFDEVGVRFAHEVHPSEIAYDYWTTVRTLEAIGHREAFGLNWDPSHFVWQDLDPVGFLWDFKDRIYHVDCKDAKRRVGNGRNGRLGSHLPWADPALRVLAVHVVDPVLEVPQEADRVEVLPDEVARVPVQPEGLAVPDGLEGAHRRPVVVGDLAGVHLMGEPDTDLVEDVQDRVPAVGEVAVARVDQLGGDRREHRDVLPDRRAGEPDHGLHTQPRRGARGELHLLGGALPHALRVAVAPHVVREHVAVPLIDRVVTDGLTLEVVGDRVHLQVVPLEQVELALDVGVVLGALPGVQVVAPAGELQTLIAPLGRQPCDLLEGQVRPLTGEQRDRSCHLTSPWSVRLSVGRHEGPAAVGGRAPLDGVEHPLHGEPVRERGGRLLAGHQGADQVDHLVGERMLVTEHVAGRPPGCDVWMFGLGDHDAPEAAEARTLGRIEIVQDVHVLEVEGQRPARAVDLDADRVLAAPREARRLERADGAPGEARHEHRCVVHRDRAALGPGRAVQAGELARHRPFVHEGLEQAAHAGDPVAGDELGEVDDV